MLDKPAQTARLVDMMKEAVPFEVELPASTLARLRAGNPSLTINATETVFEVAYEARHGGIICLIRRHRRSGRHLTHARSRAPLRAVRCSSR